MGNLVAQATQPSLPQRECRYASLCAFLMPVADTHTRYREGMNARTLELPSLDLITVSARATPRLPPAHPHPQPIVTYTSPHHSLRHPKRALAQGSYLPSSDPWVDIFERGGDVYASTLNSHSRAPTPSPMTIQTRPPRARADAPSVRHGLSHFTHDRDASSSAPLHLPETSRGAISLDEHYALKSAAKQQRVQEEQQQRELKRRQRDSQQQHREYGKRQERQEQQSSRASTDARRITAAPVTHAALDQPIPSSTQPHGPTKPLHRTGRIAIIPAAGPSLRAPQDMLAQPSNQRDARPTHVRSSSEQAIPSATMLSAPRGHQMAPANREPRERRSLEMNKPTQRSRATLPGQWKVDAHNSSGMVTLDVPRVGPPKHRDARVRQDTAPAPDTAPSATAEVALYPRRRHSPPPSREIHRYRPRRSSLDSQDISRTREPGRDPDRQRQSERQPDSVRADRDRDAERHRREHRPRHYTNEDDKSGMWLRESKFDPAALPPGDLPLTANILPPKRPQPSSRSTSHRTRPRAASESRQARSGVITPSGVHTHVLTQRGHPVLAMEHAPTRHPHTPPPAAAHAAPPDHPTLFAGQSRLKEDFDAKTLSPSVFSNDASRPRSAPPEDFAPPPKGFSGVARKLRKRPPELPKLTLNTGPTPPGPVSPPLRSPASAESRFGSLPRRFLPHRWLGR
jgi:hypothetical protein